VKDSQRDALWRKAVKQAGVKDIHFHDSKHEAATRLSKFIDVLALSHALGTKDVRLLRDTYYNNDAARSASLLPKKLIP
jgi:integrase